MKIIDNLRDGNKILKENKNKSTSNRAVWRRKC